MNSIASNLIPSPTGIITDLGLPVLDCQEMHIRFHDTVMIDQPIHAGERGFLLSAISFGEPMLVLFVPDFNRMNCEKIGEKLCNHALLHHSHVVFVQVFNRKNATLSFYDAEKGCTEPGKEAFAAALVIGAITHRLNRKADFSQGEISVHGEWDENDNHVYIHI